VKAGLRGGVIATEIACLRQILPGEMQLVTPAPHREGKGDDQKRHT